MPEKSLNESTYQSLRREIMYLKLKPGTLLSTANIAEQYKVSRTPAREAILRLNKAGLVDVFPKSRTTVSRINVRRVNEEWFIRKSLEVAVIDNFMINCSARDLMALDDMIRCQEEYSASGDFEAFKER